MIRRKLHLLEKNTSPHRKIVLVGQPNCGKSTIFNEVAGYKSVASNFPGATVEYTQSHVRINGQVMDVIDLPGVYSLTSLDPPDKETQKYLLNQNVNVIINVVDASLISRSLELTLQLMELEIPMILCLNMFDEAERKGIIIDTNKLSKRLGIPVVPTVASRGRGIKGLFQSALSMTKKPRKGRHIRGNRDVELVTARLSRFLKQELKQEISFSKHLLATKLLENDHYFVNQINKFNPRIMKKVHECQRTLAKLHGKSSDEVIGAERHALSMSIFEDVCVIRKPQHHWRDRIDDLLLHHFWGYVFLVVILYLFFNVIFRLGALVETPLVTLFERVDVYLDTALPSQSFIVEALKGAVQGLGGGIAIVLPFLFPFLLGLSLLEDVGYLPRVAFLMDAFMHKIGLHGKAVIPAVLGYGCNVPAVMATRILGSPRDRLIGSVISTMVPCAARMTIIFGLVGYYLGGTAALGIYLLNIIVIALTGGLLSKMLPEITPGLILEIPVYQVPKIKVALMKTWYRIKDFLFIAWPLLIAGSAILALLEHFNWTSSINGLLSPITIILNLPRETGMTLIFGILKKELSMLMLFQALGTHDIASVMSYSQILVFTVFVVFYIPCVATLGALFREVKWRATLFITLFTILIAIIMGLLTRFVTALFHLG